MFIDFLKTNLGIIFRFNFDILDDSTSSIDEFATVVNPDALSFPKTFTYKTIDTNKNITITDATSISIKLFIFFNEPMVFIFNLNYVI